MKQPLVLSGIICLCMVLSACSTTKGYPAPPQYTGNRFPEYVFNPRIGLQVDHYYTPRVAKLESGNWLAYELHISSLFKNDVRLEGVEVSADTTGNQILFQGSGDDFKAQFKHLAYPADSLKTTLQPGQRGVLFFWVKVNEVAPASLYHRIFINFQGRKMALHLNPLAVGKYTNVVLSSPVKGVWLVGQGVDTKVESTEGHNRLLYFHLERQYCRNGFQWIW